MVGDDLLAQVEMENDHHDVGAMERDLHDGVTMEIEVGDDEIHFAADLHAEVAVV